LYHSNQTGAYQIYLVVDGQPAVALTQEPGSAVEPAWSPDRQQIAFAAEWPGSSGMAIYTMHADGSNKREVVSGQSGLNWRPNWSPDGSQLLFQSNRDGDYEIYKINLDGTSEVNLTNHPAHDGDAAWSPDGSQIVFTSNRDGANAIYVMDADGSNVTKIFDEFWCSFPRWSPDGQWIAFAGGTVTVSAMKIYVMDAQGNNVRQVTDRVGDSVTPAWVGNDKLIFSGEVGDLSWDLFLVNVDGSNLIKLTTTPTSERFPTWLP
jgi:TolB protein